jgi:predicted ATP-grasp superfamily ATP-dependent carboligase
LKDGKAPWKAAYARDQGQLDKLCKSVNGFADNVLVQEYHPGAEAHVQVLMHRGEAFMLGEYIGEQHMPLAGGVTVQRVTCRHEPVVRDAVKLLQAISWEGIAAAQFHYDRATDQYIFLEINPRFCGGLPTIIMGGFDAPFLLWQSHFEPDKMKTKPFRLGLRTRILGGCANWTLAMMRRDELPPGQKHVSKIRALASFAWNSGPWTRDDSFALTDFKPFFVDVKQMVASRVLKSGKRDLLDLS